MKYHQEKTIDKNVIKFKVIHNKVLKIKAI